ncbi:response regulator [Phreatobacter aquaticus]|uniref:Response regulator n=1 Tax=Phreatobacter aquaticus TaxID=2570229 RepID=A0A4D7QGQ7_9HYPH|nr:response regulator [Phreatobacter aquaticus]QCK86438.1 response regulator [Phreatobacter aquaticus]
MVAARGPVFVIDDDEAVRKSLKFVLELEGLDVVLFRDGEAFLAHVDRTTDGCLLVDHFMPVMTGVELMLELRTRQVVLPAILMTVQPSDELDHRARATGFTHVLEKPLNGGTLIEAIRLALAHRA